jgi:hypothetical protein
MHGYTALKMGVVLNVKSAVIKLSVLTVIYKAKTKPNATLKTPEMAILDSKVPNFSGGACPRTLLDIFRCVTATCKACVHYLTVCSFRNRQF